MNDPKLWYESYCVALREDAQVIGGGKKNWAKMVGAQLFPEKDPEIAGRTLDDKLNPMRRERLSDEQERWIMREANRARGFSAALAFICDDTNFLRPLPKKPQEEEARLVTVIQQATSVLGKALDELHNMRNPSPVPLREVRP